MKMNLQSNKEGQMYFNNVLFGFYKQIYLRSELFREGLSHPKTYQIIEDVESKTLDIIDQRKAKGQKGDVKLKTLQRFYTKSKTLMK